MTDLNVLESLYFAALEKPAAERAAFLDAACGGDADLRARVERLLAALPRIGGFLGASPAPADRPAAAGAIDDNAGGVERTARQVLDRPAASGTIDDPADGTGTIIAGRYKLLQQVGEGGMGTVWMAEQTEPVKRRVAVKLIRVERGQSKTILSRFEAERQAIALMDHPHIARLLDAGEAPPAQVGGAPRPFFVMELVKGVPLTDFCDTHKLGIPERLRLFMQVCAAVQHAHQKGVIHRDLKPSNVLVESHDGKPVPKIIDFGLAKATGLQLSEHTLFTVIGTVMGTPLYMAPEQASASAIDVDTRTDIYALGIILYELLTGTTPITRDTMKKAALDEMLKLIREQEAPTPSSRLSSAQSAPSVAANRQTEPAKLGRFVKGELDWIVLKALAKERDRRYETANGFARDIERFLNHEPVAAGPPTTAYRLRKFVRRNRGPVTAAGLVLLTLLGGVAGTVWGLIQAERQRQLAQANERLAVAERDAKDAALKAEQQAREQAFAALRSMTADVVERKFAQGTVLTEDDRAFLRGVIAQYDAFAAIKGEDPDSRATRAEGRFRVGVIRYRLGQVKEAEADYDQALSIYMQLAADLPTNAEFRHQLARSHSNRGSLLRSTGRLPEAEKDYDQAVSIQKQLAAEFPNRPEFRQQLAISHSNRGILLRDTGRSKEAEQDYDEALRIRRQLAADFPSRPMFRQELAMSHNNRGALRRATGRMAEAEQDYDEAVRIRRQLAADFPNEPDYRRDLAVGHNNRGILRRDTGRIPEAEQDYERALRIRKQLVADFPARYEFRQELAISHNNRGLLLSDYTRRFKEAEQDYGEALGIQMQLAVDFPSRPEFRQDLARTHHNRGLLLGATGRLPEAGKDFDEALAIYKQVVAEFPSRLEFRQELANGYHSRASFLNTAGRPREAEKDLEEARSIQKQMVADFPDQPDLRNEFAGTCSNLAFLFRQRGDWVAAKPLLMEGRPHHLAALRANPRDPTYRRYYRNHLNVLTAVHAGLLEREDAVRTAETRRDLGWDPAADAYDAAGFLSRCVPIVTQNDKLDDRQRKEAAEFYGDAAIRLLREAVGKGFKDGSRMNKDAAFEPLRQRDDFRKLVAEVDTKWK
jgi:serine/threonine protein kinase/tetratricopeptide (TPR) repeat protein